MARLWTPPDPDRRAELLRWAEGRLPEDDGFASDSAVPVAVLSADDRIAAVAVYFNRRAMSIEMAVAADTPHWATRGVLTELLGYPFTVFGCRRITAVVRSDNVRSRRFVEGIGFRYEGRMPDAHKDASAIIYGMTMRRWAQSRWCGATAIQEAA